MDASSSCFYVGLFHLRFDLLLIPLRVRFLLRLCSRLRYCLANHQADEMGADITSAIDRSEFGVEEFRLAQ
jgi:hypothetical protein